MWSDKESDIDFLNFSELAESIKDLIIEDKLLPLSIGVFGDWGAGKSSVLELTKKHIDAESQDYIQIHFDAWVYQGYDDAKAALLETIVKELIEVAEQGEDKGLISKAYSVLGRINKIRALGLVMDVGATVSGIPTGGAVGKLFGYYQDATDEDGIDDEEIVSGSKKQAGELIKQGKGILRGKQEKSPPEEIKAFRKEYEDLLAQLDKPLIVYVDNLDRCTPLNAISTLEAMRLFLFLPNTAFVIAADVDMIRAAVQEYHKGSTKRHQTDYLDKLIQVPVYVPKPGQLEVRAYLLMLAAQDLGVEGSELETLRERIEKDLREAWKGMPRNVDELLKDINFSNLTGLSLALKSIEKLAPLLATSPSINGNPRIVKRLLNQVKIRKKVSQRRGMNLDEATITKLVIFERCMADSVTKKLYQMIENEGGKPNIFKQLEDREVEVEWPEEWSNEKPFIESWAALPPSFIDKDLTPAAYLSRETVPLGRISTAISSAAQKLLSSLCIQKNRISKVNKELIEDTPKEDYMTVMEGIIDQLNQVEDLTNAPVGIWGGRLLSEYDPQCKSHFSTYLQRLPKHRWATSIIKDLEGG